MKAYLVFREQSPPITHDLLLLLERIRFFSPEAEKLRDHLVLLMPYSVEIRYPDDWFMPSPGDAVEAREAAKIVADWLRELEPRLFEKP